MKIKQLILIFTVLTIAICLQDSVKANDTNRLRAPSLDPGKAQAHISNDILSLKNNVIVMSWEITDGHLQPREISSLVQNQTWSQRQCDFFRVV